MNKSYIAKSDLYLESCQNVSEEQFGHEAMFTL